MKRVIQLLFIFFFFGTIAAQQTDYVDFKLGYSEIDIRYHKLDSINGVMQYTFDIIQQTDSIFLDAKGMQFDKVFLNEKPVEFNNDGLKLWIVHDFQPSQENILYFQYVAQPKKALYIVDRDDSYQLWTQGQGQYTSHWLPSIDDVNDKIIFSLSLAADKEYQVLSNGVLDQYYSQDQDDLWFYKTQKPMSSYLVALVIGQYNKKAALSNSGVPLEYYYYPEDSLKAEPTYRYTKEIFDFLEDEIGFPYPWQNYKQVPVKDFLYSGMENASLTVFSDVFVVDSTTFSDKNYVTVNAHELAHQWFGNLVTATSSEHHWLQEGFSTYYALLAERAVLGEDHYYWQLFENAQELIVQEEAGESSSLLDPKSSSTTFYKKGAWALHILRERVGDSAFKLAVKTYLETHQFASVETSDFVSEVEKASGEDLTDFVSEWLLEKTLPEDVIVKSLKQSQYMIDYFMVDCEIYTSECQDYLASSISDKAKVKVISQILHKIDASAFQNSLEVRQAIAKYIDKIPFQLKSDYETLLNDASYLTIENALYHLWANFPQDRAKYLQKTKDIIGFNDYNVRLLWLALHLNTVEYQPEKKQDVLKELIGYSLPESSFELRTNAFNYLKLVGGFEARSLSSLLEATTHHNWRFSSYAKKLILELEEDESYKSIMDTLRNK